LPSPCPAFFPSATPPPRPPPPSPPRRSSDLPVTLAEPIPDGVTDPITDLLHVDPPAALAVPAFRADVLAILTVVAVRLPGVPPRSEEHTSELQSRENLVCRLLLEKKKSTRSG